MLILALLDQMAVLAAKLSQPPKTPGNSVTPAGAKLQWQSTRWRSPFFTFMTARDVPPTNNAAERARRPSVILPKVTNGLMLRIPRGHRSIWSGDIHALIRSIIGRRHGLPAHQAISRPLAGQTMFAI